MTVYHLTCESCGWYREAITDEKKALDLAKSHENGEPQHYVNVTPVARPVDSETDEKSVRELVAPGVTTDELAATQRTLEGFTAAAEDEWGEVPEWLETSLSVIHGMSERGDREVDPNPTHFVSDNLDGNLFRELMEKSRKENAFVLIDEAAQPGRGKVDMAMRLAQRFNRARKHDNMESKECSKNGCGKDSTTTIRYPSNGELRSYCDEHIRHLMEMHVPFEGTANPEE